MNKKRPIVTSYRDQTFNQRFNPTRQVWYASFCVFRTMARGFKNSVDRSSHCFLADRLAVNTILLYCREPPTTVIWRRSAVRRTASDRGLWLLNVVNHVSEDEGPFSDTSIERQSNAVWRGPSHAAGSRNVDRATYVFRPRWTAILDALAETCPAGCGSLIQWTASMREMKKIGIRDCRSQIWLLTIITWVIMKITRKVIIIFVVRPMSYCTCTRVLQYRIIVFRKLPRLYA